MKAGDHATFNKIILRPMLHERRADDGGVKKRGGYCAVALPKIGGRTGTAGVLVTHTVHIIYKVHRYKLNIKNPHVEGLFILQPLLRFSLILAVN